MAETEAQRLARQRDNDLIERGRELERTNGRIVALEDHAKAVNGQIKGLTGEIQQVRGEVQQTNATLAEVVHKLDERAKYSAERDQRQLSKVTIISFVTGGLISLGMLITTILEVVK